ncbi:MAG: hypothetical protein BroJett026_35350 [Betaproteobacteria bacterium]|nr:MAG: hypothetical protein BroJett026_35350 [Betaproteobacteria bacterium]
MSIGLQRRIAELEAKAPALKVELVSDHDCRSAVQKSLYELQKKFAISGYDDWRHEGLTLEELLALAKHDDACERATPKAQWEPGLRQVSEGQWVPFSAAHAAREFEVRILERDGTIDDTTARSLRDNAQAHFLCDGPQLDALPHAIVMDEATVLAAALAKCPRREDLPLEDQLALVHEDRRRELLEREQRKSAPARPGFTPASSTTLASIDAYGDQVFERRVADIASRLQLARPHG